MRQKLNFLEGACPIASGIKPTQHFIKRTSYQQSNMVVEVWCSGASGPGRLAIIDATMNSALYQKILKENVHPSVCAQAQVHLGYAAGQWSQTHQQVHLWMPQEKVLVWPSQSPDLNPIEMLWHDLKQSLHASKPSNVAELNQFCKDEWDKIPPQRCERLIACYRKRLIAAKGGTTSY